MAVHKCNKCKMIFSSLSNLNRHQKSTQSCKFNSKTSKKISYKCKYCKKKFSRNDALKQHINKNRCPVYKQKFNIKENNGVISNKLKGHNCIIQSPNSVINNPVTINLVLFGKDGIRNLTYDEINKLFKTNINLVEFLVKAVNLNPEKPQHHNILYTNLRSAYGKSFKNDGWVSNKIDELIDTLIDAKLEDLSDILNEMEFLDKKAKNKIKETITNLDHKRPFARKKLASYLKPILYNHRDMIVKTMHLTQEQEQEIFRKQQLEAEIDAENEDIKIKEKTKKIKKIKNLNFFIWF